MPGCGSGAGCVARNAPRLFTAEYLAGLTGGIFLCHVIFINLVRSGLGAAGLTPHLGWAGMVAVTFVLTMGSAALFTALVQRTPLRWVLGGPVRAEQRARLGRAEPATTVFVDARDFVVGAAPEREPGASDGAGAALQRCGEEAVPHSGSSPEALILSLHFLMKFFARSQYQAHSGRGHCCDR